MNQILSKTILAAALLLPAAYSQQPIAYSGSFSLVPQQFQGGTTFDVPLGKRLIVEFVNVNCNPFGGNGATLPAINRVGIGTYTFVGNLNFAENVINYFSPSQTRKAGFIYTGQVRMYADRPTSPLTHSIEVFVEPTKWLNASSNEAYACTVNLIGTLWSATT